MKNKIKKWLKRYLPAEIFGTLSAIAGAGLAYSMTNNGIISAYAGTISENVGFYGYMLIKEVYDSKIHHKNNNRKYTFTSFLKNARNLILEFGLAEIFDSLLLRPFFMYLFPLIIGNFALGIFVGKIVADITFYIPAIIAYELRKKHLID